MRSYDFGEEAGPGRNRPPGPRKVKNHRDMEGRAKRPFKSDASILTNEQVERERQKGTPVIEVVSEEEKAAIRRRKRKGRR